MNPKVVDIERAVEILKQGELILYPTETVYGIGGDVSSDKVLEKLFQIKGRPENQAISILIDSYEMLETCVEEVPPVARNLIQKYWPGPLTLIFHAKPHLSERLLGGGNTIAVRISNNQVAQGLVQKLGRPITSTSANPSGKEAARNLEDCYRYFPQLSLVDGGSLPLCAPSTLVDVSSGSIRVIRKGAVIL